MKMTTQARTVGAGAHVHSSRQPAKIKVANLYRQSVAYAWYEMIDGMRKIHIDIDEVFCQGVNVIPKEDIDFEGYPKFRKMTENVQINVDYKHPTTQIVKKKRVPYKPRSYSEGEEKALADAIRQVEAQVAAIKREEEYVSSGNWQADMETLKRLELDLMVDTIMREKESKIGPQSGNENDPLHDEFVNDVKQFVSSLGFHTRDVDFDLWICEHISTKEQLEFFVQELEAEPARIRDLALTCFVGSPDYHTQIHVQSTIETCLRSYFGRWKWLIDNLQSAVSPQAGEEQFCENEGIFVDQNLIDDRADRLFRSPDAQDDESSYFSSASDTSEDTTQEMLLDFMDRLKSIIADSCKTFNKFDEKLAERIEAIFWFLMFDWPKCSNRKELIAMVIRLVSRLIGMKRISNAGKWLIEMFETTIKPQAASEAFHFDYAWLTDVSKGFVTSELYSRLVKFSCALMTLAVSSSFKIPMDGSIFERVWSAAKMIIMNKKFDVISSVLAFIPWLLKSGMSILRGTLSLKSFFTTPSDIQLFDMRVAKLDYWKTELEAGREEVCTMLSFGIEVTTLSKFACELSRSADKVLRLTLAAQIRRIDAHWVWYRNKENEKPLRKAPFSILLEGGTGVAKSSMLPYIITMLQHKLKLKVGPEHVYDYNPSEAYMSGFSNLINTIILDDIGNTQPLYQERASSQTIIDIINNNKKVAIMADIDSKGQYLIKPEIVMGTTNVDHLNAGQTSNCPISILRRWNFCINVTMKPEYAGQGGVRRDDVNPDLERMDVWLLTVYKWVPDDNGGRPVKSIILQNESFENVCRFLLDEASQYNQKQANMVHTATNLKHVRICECGLLDYVCKLHNPGDPRVQRGEVADGTYVVDRVVPNAGYDWSPAHALFETFDSRSHKTGLDFLKSKFLAFMMRADNMVRLMCTVTVVRADARANSLWCFLMYLCFNIPSYLIYVKVWALASCGLIVVPTMSMIMTIMMFIAYAISVFRRPIYKSLKEAVDHVITRPTSMRAAKFAALIITIGAMYEARKLFYSKQIKPQGGGISKEAQHVNKKALEARAEGISNVKDIYREQYIKPVEKNYNTKTMTAEQMCGVLQDKMLYARFLCDNNINGIASQCVVFPICSEYLLVPWHILRNDTKKYLQIMSRDSNVNNASRLFGIEGRWKRIAGTDCALVRSPSVGSQKDIIHWFPEGSVSGDIPSKLCNNTGCRLVWLKGVREGGVDVDLNVRLSRGMELVAAQSGLVNDVKFEETLHYWGGSYMTVIPTYDGMCGSPLVTDRTSSPMILGVHSAGATTTVKGRFCTVGRQDILNTLALFQDDIVPNSIMHESSNHVQALQFSGTNFEYTIKQCERATSPYIAGQYEVLGYTKEPRRNFKSAVQITEWSEELESKGLPRKHEAPQLMNSYVPWNMWLNNTSKPSLIDPQCLDLAKDDYIRKVVSGIESDPEKMRVLKQLVRVLPHEVTLAGLDGVKGIDAINRKTSMGIPWCRPKHEFVFVSEDEYPGISVPLKIDAHMKQEIDTMERKLKEGQRVYVPHRCNLKDEAVKLNKAKVRVFMGSPFPYIYLMRKYFLGISSYIQAYPYLFETAVGINCYGPEWTKLREYLTTHGERTIFAGDYKAFDQKMEISVVKTAFEVFLVLGKMAGYTNDDLTVCRGLMTETIEGCYNLKGEWIGLFGGNPSGHSMTVVVNGVGNAVQMRAPYYALAPIMPPPFHTQVALITYGDDNVANVSPNIPWYNHTTVANKFAEWGITYTMADKEEESKPYIDIERASFLKRSWMYCNTRKRYLAPLDHDSILKTLHTYVESKVLDKKEQHAELLLSANREYFMYGYETFDRRRGELSDIAVKYGVSHFLPGGRLPTRDELDEWVLSAY